MISSKRYSLTGELLGEGCWGKVYRGKDKKFGNEVAIKVFSPTDVAEKQMKHRGLDTESAMKKEALELSNCSSIVPRNYEEDDNGQPFIVMPVYRESLADRLEHSRLNNETVQSLALDIAKGIAELHSNKRVHQDIKPDNFLISDTGHALLSDLGTSTVVEHTPSGANRDNMGCVYTRASECYKEGVRPTERSDVFGESALIYRLFTGHYPFEEEIDNSKDPGKLMEQLRDSGLGDKIIKNKVNKNIPKDFRKLLIRGMSFDPNKRFWNGNEFKDKLEYVIKNQGFIGKVKKYFKSASISAYVAGIIGFGVYGGLTSNKGSDITETPRIVEKGLTLIGNPIKMPEYKFEQEKVPYPVFLPQVILGGGLAMKRISNPYVAYLTKAYFGALESNPEGFARSFKLTPVQSLLLKMEYESRVGINPKSDLDNTDKINSFVDNMGRVIQYSMNASKNDKGIVDLEDMCVVATLGKDVLAEAKKDSGSRDYAVYRYAKDSSGKRIISDKQLKFIDDWRGYINSP